jgi:2-hydroxycyclohexanecarboxyl-CoA dehydrogenase
MTGMERRVALVTGGASGIGAATCVALHEDGFDVAVLDRDGRGAEATAKRCGNGLALIVDLRDERAVHQAVADVIAWRGRIDAVVNAAGVLHRTGLADTDAETWARVLDINLTGAFRVCQAALPHLLDGAEDGTKRIINIGSCAGEIGYAYPAYTASKGGIIALTRQLAAELAPHRITVNVVNPGFIRTPINDDAFTDPAQVERVSERIPLGRLGRPEEVAAVVRFLATPAAGYITAETIRVDGGQTAIGAIGSPKKSGGAE